MVSITTRRMALVLLMAMLGAVPAIAQPSSSIRVQCPTTPHYPGAPIKCLHLSAGDGFATMADTTPLYVFSFSNLPLDTTPDEAMMQGMLAANIPAPRIELDEGDELYLNLTNVGMKMRPDLFDPHSVHWHGFPQAAPVFDGVPDSSAVINMGATFTYYYLANDPGTYLYHCHVEATEHMQMGMIGNLYVRPKQNKTGCPGSACPVAKLGGGTTAPLGYAYNDGDGSTAYDIEFPIQITSFDPVFHEASVSVNPLPFADMKDRYFMLNGRGYPDTVDTTTPCLPPTVHPAGSSNGPTQCQNALVTAGPDQRVLLRLSNVSVTEYVTIGTIGIPMQVIARDARLLRGDAETGFPNGRNQYYTTNSITLGGGEAADVILDTTGLATNSTYFLYAKNLHFLSNDAENFGGAMTEIRIQ
jgi:FtsP/CotA-like multicopper oxidase with cupredoxin domain